MQSWQLGSICWGCTEPVVWTTLGTTCGRCQAGLEIPVGLPMWSLVGQQDWKKGKKTGWNELYMIYKFGLFQSSWKINPQPTILGLSYQKWNTGWRRCSNSNMISTTSSSNGLDDNARHLESSWMNNYWIDCKFLINSKTMNFLASTENDTIWFYLHPKGRTGMGSNTKYMGCMHVLGYGQNPRINCCPVPFTCLSLQGSDLPMSNMTLTIIPVLVRSLKFSNVELGQ